MAQPKPKSNLPKLVIGAVVVAGIAFYMTGGNDAPKSTAAPIAKKKSSANSNSILQPIDSNVTYPGITLAMQDKFVPLVYKTISGKLEGPIWKTDQLTIPPALTGGESNWAFTGTVNVDGKWSALVENSTSAQNAYLKPGEKWKTSTVDRVTENLLILRDLSGTTKEIPMQADVQAMLAKQQADVADLRVNANAGNRNQYTPNAPFNPLMGAIGDTTVQADGSTAVAAAAGGSPASGYGGGGSRRNRGGGGGGRGGRGGGGNGGGGFGNGG